VMAVKTSFKSPVPSLPDQPHHPKNLTFVWKVQACSFSAEPVVQYLAILSASARTQRMCVVRCKFCVHFLPQNAAETTSESKIFLGGDAPRPP